MFAKSIPETSAADRPADALPRVRQLLTLVLVLTSLSTLIVLLEERLGVRVLGSALAVVQQEATAILAQPEAVPADNERHVALAEFLAKRYKVAQELTLDFVRIAHAEGGRVGLDPLLIMAVIAVESRYNPIAESVMGAKGLMQIIPRFHGDKLAAFGGERAVFDPEANIRVGTRILKEYFTKTGNLGIALQMYAGALNDDNDTYTTKVLGEKQRLQQVVANMTGPAPTATRVSQRRERQVESPLGERI
jgi:soluble lytic murein transglycosylase-like protein